MVAHAPWPGKPDVLAAEFRPSPSGRVYIVVARAAAVTAAKRSCASDSHCNSSRAASSGVGP